MQAHKIFRKLFLTECAPASDLCRTRRAYDNAPMERIITTRGKQSWQINTTFRPMKNSVGLFRNLRIFGTPDPASFLQSVHDPV